MNTNFDISNTTPMIDGRIETSNDESRLKLRQTSYEAARMNIQKYPVPVSEVENEVSSMEIKDSSEQAEVSRESEEPVKEEKANLDDVSFEAVDDRIYGLTEAKALKVKTAKVDAMIDAVVLKFPDDMVIKTNEIEPIPMVSPMQEVAVEDETKEIDSSEPSQVEPVDNGHTISSSFDPAPVVPENTVEITPSQKEFIPLDVPRESLVDEFSNLTEFSDLLKALDHQRTATIDAQTRVSEKQDEFDRLVRDADDVFATSENNLREAERKRMEAEKRFQSAEEMNEQLKRKVKELAREQQKVMEEKEQEAHEFVGHLDSQIDELNHGKYKDVADNNEQADKYLAEAGEYNQNAEELEKQNADFNQLLAAITDYEGMTPEENGEQISSYPAQEEESYRKVA